MNDTTISGSVMASALTEGANMKLRAYHTQHLISINKRALRVVTGNGVRAAGDHIRRWLQVNLDAKMSAPWTRTLSAKEFREKFEAMRAHLLAAHMTILRYGVQNRSQLVRGKGMGSFDDWLLVRDVMLTLGCKDPVERMLEAKQDDPALAHMARFYRAVQTGHKFKSFPAAALCQEARRIIDPDDSLAFLQQKLRSIVKQKTRINGLTLVFAVPPDHNHVALYALAKAVDGQEAVAEPDHAVPEPNAARGKPAVNGRPGIIPVDDTPYGDAPARTPRRPAVH